MKRRHTPRGLSDPTAAAALGNLDRLAWSRSSEMYYRRASRQDRALWAQMAGKQNAPRSGNPEAFTTPTECDSANGCNTDGA